MSNTQPIPVKKQSSNKNKPKRFKMIHHADTVHITINPKPEDLIAIDQTEHPLRPSFISAISFFCTPEEFELIGMNLLLNKELFAQFVIMSNTNKSTEEHDNWWLNVIRKEISKTNPMNAKTTETETIMTTTSTTPVPELNVTMDDTALPETQDPRDVELLALRAELIRRDGEVLREQLLKQAKESLPAADKEEAVKQLDEVLKSGTSWKGFGKTVSIASFGVVAGGAAMWAFKKYFG